MPALAAEGGDSRNLARLASRLARANAAVEVLADGAERYLALMGRDAPAPGFDANVFAGMPEEIRLRLLLRAIDRVGHEGGQQWFDQYQLGGWASLGLIAVGNEL